jgi:MYXO-CTERM domain-containing protein
MFSGAHLHLLVNHAPIFGSLFALGLLVVSYFTATDVLRRTAFVVLIATAIAGVAADLSGDPAKDAIRGFPGVRRDVIRDHEDMGDKSYFIGGVVGLLALGALVRWRRKPVPGSATLVMLLATAVLSGAMVYTGLLGGRVRHTEVRPGATNADAMTIEPPRQRPPPHGGP